ncbi:MAG: DUF3168 domain-containing protein [Vicinamibacterales bacterium]
MSDAVALARLRCLETSALTALVGTRVYTGILPQSVTVPAVLIELVGGFQDGHLRGGNSLRMTRIQITAVAATRAEAVAVQAAIDGDNAGSALAYWRGGIGSPAVQVSLCEPVGDPREEYVAGELRQFRRQQDFRMYHR